MKTLITTLALAGLGFGAFATEATQFTDPPSTLTRAQAQSREIGQRLGRSIGDATVFAEPVDSRGEPAEQRARATAAALQRSGPGEAYGEAAAFSRR